MKKTSMVGCAIMMAAVFICAFAGCGGGSSTPASVAGNWEFKDTTAGHAANSSVLILTQNGSQISGTLGGAPVTGVVDGNSIAMTVNLVGGAVYDGTVSGSQMSGTWSNAGANFTGGTWTAQELFLTSGK